MTKETVKDWGVKFSTAALTSNDTDLPEYLVAPVADRAMADDLVAGLARANWDDNATVGYYEFDLEDGRYVGTSLDNGQFGAYVPGDGMREIEAPAEG